MELVDIIIFIMMGVCFASLGYIAYVVSKWTDKENSKYEKD